jgi:hypothetical protein
MEKHRNTSIQGLKKIKSSNRIPCRVFALFAVENNHERMGKSSNQMETFQTSYVKVANGNFHYDNMKHH